MALVFDGIEYRTIADVKEQFKVSEKSLKKWIKEGHLPEPRRKLKGGGPFGTTTKIGVRNFPDSSLEKGAVNLGS